MEKNRKKTIKTKSTSEVSEQILVKIENTTQSELKVVKNDIPDMITGYINTNTPFRIYFRGSVIFDTKNTLRKNYPIIGENEFILGTNKYIYKGISVETY